LVKLVDFDQFKNRGGEKFMSEKELIQALQTNIGSHVPSTKGHPNFKYKIGEK